jgi:uncharacterized protein (DUF2252 family)
MSQSAFAFYRGTAALMANDLGPRPNSGLTVQLCGDAHLGNFGIFATADRRTIFDVNDFDETFPGPFEWDVQRMVTSFAIASTDRSEECQEAVIRAGAEAYRIAMAAFATSRFVDTWYYRVDAKSLKAVTKSGALSESGMAKMNKGSLLTSPHLSFDFHLPKASRRLSITHLHVTKRRFYAIAASCLIDITLLTSVTRL